MNKTELVKRVSKRMSITQVEAHRFVTIFETTLIDALEEDNSLMLQGFGTFTLWEQTEREGRNPRTGEACTIPPRLSAKFKPGKQLLKKLNKLG